MLLPSMRRFAIIAGMDAIHIDGSYGEGGGQVLRTSLSLAVLVGCELTMEGIRSGRRKPGLAGQHVTCVRAAAAICGAEVEGDEVGSQELRFRPGRVMPGEYEFDVSDVYAGAGATGLVFQAVLPPLLLAGGDSRVVIRGGTNVPWSPSFEYLRGAFLPALARAGARVSLERTRGGWYPGGGGEIVAEVRGPGAPLAPLQLVERGALRALTVVSTVSEQLPRHILGRQAEGALGTLPDELARLAAREHERPAGGPGTCLALLAQFQTGHAGATALGERGVPAEKVGARAAAELNAFLDSGAAVDAHLGDQLLLPAALADGASVILAEQNTEHLRTNAWVVRQFLDANITIEGERPVRIAVDGVGHRPA